MAKLRKEAMDAKLDLFWDAMGTNLNISESCRMSKVTRNVVYVWKNANPDEWAEKYEVARKSYVERLRKEIVRRGVEGYEEPVYFRGEIVGKIKKYSDNLLMFEAKRWEGQYATERREITGKDGGPVQQKYDVVVKLEKPPESVAHLVQLIDEDKI